MKKNYITLMSFCLITLFLLNISLVSAFLDVKHFNKDVGKYGQLEIDDWLFLNKADYTLINYGSSVINVWAEGEYKLYKKTHLFSGIFYKDIIGGKGNLKNTRFFIWETKFETRYNPIYKTNCYLNSLNGTAKEICESILISNKSYQADVSEWTLYKEGADLEESEGRWRLEAERPANQIIDFVLEAHGQEFNEWAWWNNTFAYRKKIVINSDLDLTEYQFNYTLSYDAHMKSDFGDIRFTYYNATTELQTELSYWNETNYASDNMTVWIKSNLETGNNTIYMYYGNAGATTTSSGTDTFIQFNGSNTVAYLMPLVIYNNYVAEFKIKVTDDAPDFHPQATVTNTLAMNDDHIMFDIYTGGVTGYASNGGTDSNSGILGPQWLNGEYHKLRAEVSATGVTFFKNDTQIGSEVTGNLPNTNGGLAVRLAKGTYEQDWAFLRKYTATVPTVLETGAEEDSNKLTITSISPINYYNSSSQDVSFNCSGTDEIGLYSLNLTINGTVYETITGVGNTNLSLTSTETLSDGYYNWYCTGNDDTETETSTTRYLTVDLTSPSISTSSNLTDLITSSLPINSTWNYTASDIHIDSCYYNTTENATQIIITCNASINTTWTTGGNKTIRYCANDSLGFETCNTTTILINYIQEKATYESSVIEQEDTIIILNITATSITSFNGTLNYNGADYTPTVSNNSITGLLTSTIKTPFVDAESIIFFNWTYTLNGIDYNSSNYNQTILHLTDLNISVDCEDKALRFDLQDEGNLSAIYGDIYYNFKYGISNSSFKTTYGSLTNITTFYLCINASVSENYTIGYGEIQYNDGIYVDRRYYLFNGQVISNNTLTNHTLRNLLATDQTSFLLTMEDTSLNVYDNKYTALWRWYPDLDEYQIVEMGKTDEDGQTVSHVDTEDVDYRVGLYHLNGTLIKLGDPLRFLCTSAPCSFTLRVGAGETDYSSFFDVQTSLTYNETTGMFTFIYNDPNQYTSGMRLLVTRETGSDTLTICDDTSSGFTGVMSCNTSAYTGVKRAVVYRSASPPIIIAQKLITDINNTFQSEFGLVISMFLWLAIVLSGFGNNPIWTIILGVVGLIPALIVGSINLTIFTGIAILGAIIIHFMKRAVAR